MNKSPFGSTIEKTKKKYSVVTLFYKPSGHPEKSIVTKIAPELGSNLFSLTYGKEDIILFEKKLLESCGFTGNFPLFPTPNRVKDFTYTWQGKQTLLKKRGHIIELHGLVFDEPWNYLPPKVGKNSVTFATFIEITKKSPLYEAYPYACKLSLEYILYSNRIQVKYTVVNKENSSLPFGFALHPYFNRLSGNDKTFVCVPARYWMESPKATLLPSGKLIDVAQKPYDIRKPAAVGSLTLDHVYTGLIPKQFPYIDYQTKQLKVHLITTNDFTHVVVYTGHPKAVCIENQTCSTDAHNLWAKGLKKESHLIVIPKGKKHTGSIIYKIEKY